MKKLAKVSLLLALVLYFTPILFADSVVLYNNIPSPLAPNIPSLGYEATGTSEFGGLIHLAGSGSSFSLDSASVVMSDWALASGWSSSMNGTTITAAGFYLPLTLSFYSVGSGNTVGALISSTTIDPLIAWRPEASASCGTAWLASNGNCYNGLASVVTFNLAGVNVPGQVIYGLSYNTTDYGSSPTGVPGPYDSLNFGLSSSAPSVGSNPLTGTAYWATIDAGDYADGGAGGTGTFRQDTSADWSTYSGAIELTTDGASAGGEISGTETPEPGSLLLLGSGLFGLAGVLFWKSRHSGNS
jgi:hypothetical protein